METTIQCPHCESADNPPNARFCINCRGQLFQVCPSCLSELPWHFENCPKCGVNIDKYREKTKLAETEKKDNELEENQRELSQVQNDLQFVQSPPLSAYISTYSKSQKRFRDLGKTSIWGCGMGVFDLIIVYPAIVLFVSMILMVMLRPGIEAILYFLAFTALLGGIMWFRFNTFIRKPALEKLKTREIELQKAIRDLTEV